MREEQYWGQGDGDDVYGHKDINAVILSHVMIKIENIIVHWVQSTFNW